jgi:hypothetical protein
MFPAAGIVLSERATDALSKLEATDSAESRSIARRVRTLRPILLADCLHGEVVRKPAIPRSLSEKYGLENLFVEDLPNFWRFLYTVVRHSGKRMIVVIEIVDHRTYDRWFPGRGN